MGAQFLHRVLFWVCVLYLVLDTLGMQDREGAGNCLTFTQTSMAKQDYRDWVIARSRVSEISLSSWHCCKFPFLQNYVIYMIMQEAN